MFLLVFECQLTCCMRGFFFFFFFLSPSSAVFVWWVCSKSERARVRAFSKCSRMSRFTISGSTQKFGAITGDGHIRGLSNQHILSQPKKTPNQGSWVGFSKPDKTLSRRQNVVFILPCLFVFKANSALFFSAYQWVQQVAGALVLWSDISDGNSWKF